MIQLVARLGLNARGFLTGIAGAESALGRFAARAKSVYKDSEFLQGAVNSAGGFAMVRFLEKLFPSKSGGSMANQAGTSVKVPISPVGPSIDAGNLNPRDPLMLSSKFKWALAAGAAAGGYLLNQGMERMGELKDLSEQSDLTAEAVQRLDAAARSAGLSFDNFGTALAAGNMSRKEAVEVNEKLRETFAKYGVTLADLRNPMLSTLDLMRRMGQASEGMNRNAVRADFRDIFGKGSEKLIPALGELDKDRPIISERSIQAVDRLSKALEKVGMAAKTAGGELFGGLLARAQDYMDKPGTRGNRLGQWALGVNQRLFGWLAKPFGFNTGSPGNPIARATMPEAQMFNDLVAQKALEDELEKQARLKEQIHQSELQAMSDEQRRLRLIQERLGYQRELADLVDYERQYGALGASVPESEKMALQLKIAQITAALNRQDNKVSMGETQADQLSRIGVFAAGANIATTRYLERIAWATEGTREAIENSGESL